MSGDGLTSQEQSTHRIVGIVAGVYGEKNLNLSSESNNFL